MNLLRKLQPSTIGIALFIIAAAVLSAVIVTGHIGQLALANVLINIAQPSTACAIAVLTYLTILDLTPKTDSEEIDA